MNTVRSQELHNGRTTEETRRSRTKTGIVSASFVKRMLLALVRVTAGVLIVLSVVGTFYGARGQDAAAPLQIVLDIWQAPLIAVLAVGIQGLLSVIQWGSRAAADDDVRWWALYGGALALSAWWNWTAYGDPLIAVGVPWLLAAGIVIAGDIYPEFALVDG